MKRVVIIGGGFAGAFCAKKLQNDFHVTLINSEDYFEYVPSVLRTIVEPLHAKKIQVLHKNYLKRGKFIMGKANKITGKEVFWEKKKIKFDYLIISTGSAYRAPIKGKEVILSHRADTLSKFHDKLHEAKRVLIIGGGIVGVELAAEICTHYKDKEIILVHSHDKLMERMNKKTQRYAENFLKKGGVKILFDERVKDKRGKDFITEKGTKIKANLVFFCTGIKPNSQLIESSFKGKLDERNNIKVNNNLQLEGFKNIFSAGDVNSIREEKTAQNAEEQAEIIVKNIYNLENKRKLEKYESKPRIMVISLGKYDGIFTYKNFSFSGLIPAFLKWFVEWKTMRHYR